MLSQVARMIDPGGLSNTSPPGASLHYPAQSTLADHMEIDQLPDNTAPLPQAITQNLAVSSSQAYQNTSHHESRALSNLLQALGHGHTSNASPGPPASALPLYPEATNILPMNDRLVHTHTPPGDNEANGALPYNHGPVNNPSLPNSLSELPTFPAPSHVPDQSIGLVTNGLPPPDSAQVEPPVRDRREVEAFAKIEFEDGNYYITTWQCELGRDARAYYSALEKARALENNPATSQSSSGQLSRPSERVLQYVDSQVQGSVLSEAGGFGGIDQDPLREKTKADGRGYPSQSSQLSSSDVVRPQEVLYHPPTAPFDYHKNAEMQARALDPELEEPAPITDDHAPDPDLCPIIPIHSMSDSLAVEIMVHRTISRRHVRIEWDFTLECFVLRVLGRNGAFVDGELLEMGDNRRLTSGSNIQIGGIEMNFLLPTMKADPISDESDDEIDEEASNRQSTSLTPNGASEILDGQQKMIPHDSATQAASAVLLGPDGNPIVKKRGPGRPPKDGHMSQREKKLLKKQIELAEAKAANGGTTPPPMGAAKKPSKLPTKEELARFEGKSEKRKYNKRKREGEDGDIMPSIEGGEEAIDSNDERPVAKKSRASRSPSPEYPPLAGLTEEQLQRPTEPYAKVIYDLLLEIYPKALPLKGVYRMIKMRYPFFVHRVESDGWQSSVRHNLNQEHEKLFDKGDKEGKGYAWRAIPGAMRKEERKKAAPAATSKPKPTPQNLPQPKNLPNQQSASWPNNQSYPPQYWPQSQQSPYAPPREMQYPGQSSHGLMGQSVDPATNGITSQQKHSSLHELPASPPNYPPYRPAFPRQGPALPTNPGTAAPNMPCTLEGIMAIRKYEESMYDQIRKGSNPQSLEYWMQVFASVRKRILHGQPGSIMPSGETQEELAIMGHVGMIRDRFRNINFLGFGGERRLATPMTAGGAVTSDRAVTHLGNGKVKNDDGKPIANGIASYGAAGATAMSSARDVDTDRSMTASPLTPSAAVNGDVPHSTHGSYVPNPDRVV